MPFLKTAGSNESVAEAPLKLVHSFVKRVRDMEMGMGWEDMFKFLRRLGFLSYFLGWVKKKGVKVIMP